jgi:glycosyltransferase involved in cell wall biosynthesis
VVVDDGSTDAETRRTVDQVASRDVRVICQKNQGLSAARNTGVLAADAPFFVPLDADDRLDPAFIERLLPPLLADATLGYAYSHAQCFGASRLLWECPAYDPRRLLVENQSVATAVIRRAAYDEVGGYSRDMVHGFEDWDFWIGLLSVGYAGYCVPEPLFFYRKHDTGSMLTATQRRRPEMVRQMIAHHRALFAGALEVSLADKDAMFFEAHQQADQLQHALLRRGTAVGIDDAVYDKLLARAEVDYIEGSRFWRLASRFALTPRGADVSSDDPHARLRRIKASPAYRQIQLIKRTPVYKWYGRRKYGSEFDHTAHTLHR